eukprot:CAMPEP_0117028630 /NCGR_PEP_ID=MMETSP0472-20121206/20807_1 /TAXON_ID=693140 ORGANISM="Tiarina fusus, Strain LIS" /NCGR_SAMPLE_ID=MMETSP0472 /ASSEMBLY_ACC=CAM_ASM_000603 /LENGTH=183 /DNA_ID=CAMNT_0004736185 /DNA_START=31 /DNA_END=582 /DNA_ORIENTATION=+
MTDSSAVLYGLLGAGSALIFSCAGAAIGTAKAQFSTKNTNSFKNLDSGSDADVPLINVNEEVQTNSGYKNNAGGSVTKMQSLIPVIIAGVLAIYGLIYSIIVVQSVSDPAYSLARGYAQFAGGLTVGFCCLASGIAVGVVAKSGFRGIKQNTSSFVMMVLNLIYCEALGLYGLIFGLIAASTF